jgi:hypothetical protein
MSKAITARLRNARYTMKASQARAALARRSFCRPFRRPSGCSSVGGQNSATGERIEYSTHPTDEVSLEELEMRDLVKEAAVRGQSLGVGARDLEVERLLAVGGVSRREIPADHESQVALGEPHP